MFNIFNKKNRKKSTYLSYNKGQIEDLCEKKIDDFEGCPKLGEGEYSNTDEPLKDKETKISIAFKCGAILIIIPILIISMLFGYKYMKEVKQYATGPVLTPEVPVSTSTGTSTGTSTTTKSEAGNINVANENKTDGNIINDKSAENELTTLNTSKTSDTQKSITEYNNYITNKYTEFKNKSVEYYKGKGDKYSYDRYIEKTLIELDGKIIALKDEKNLKNNAELVAVLTDRFTILKDTLSNIKNDSSYSTIIPRVNNVIEKNNNYLNIEIRLLKEYLDNEGVTYFVENGQIICR